MSALQQLRADQIAKGVGGGGNTHTHTQNTAASTWTITHNLDHQFVSVRVNDFTGTVLIPDIDYTSANVVTLSYASPRQGIAQISK